MEYGKIILNRDSGWPLVEVVDSTVYVYDPRYMLLLVEWVETGRFAAIAGLASLLVDDLALLRGTHSVKDRVLARLRKFISVVEVTRICPSLQPALWGTQCIPLGEVYYTSLLRLRKALSAARLYRDYIHGIRDRVHELLYPHIRKALEGFAAIKVSYPTGRGIKIEMEAYYDPLEHRTNTFYTLKKPGRQLGIRISRDTVMETLMKRINRERTRRLERLRLVDYEYTVEQGFKLLYGGRP